MQNENNATYRVLVWALLVTFCLCSTNVSNDANFRLPDTLLPSKYALEIHTNLDGDFEFFGSVLIEITCVKPTNKVILHSKDLEITQEKVTFKDGATVIKIVSQNFDKGNDLYIVTVGETLAPQKVYSLFIPFKGKLVEAPQGYFKSSYSYFKDGKKVTRYSSGNNFEMNAARRCFPCFDEPALKAIFAVSLGHDEQYTALSNMPQIPDKRQKIPNKPNWVLDFYEETPPMSTYLVTIVVSDLQPTRVAIPNNNKLFQVWAWKDVENQLQPTTETLLRVLPFLESYFSTPFDLPKLDIALLDYQNVAMEGYGLFVINYHVQLYDPKEARSYDYFYSAEDVSHELVHLWFGDRVTHKWWDQYWLKEAFATFLSPLAQDRVNPQWGFFESYMFDMYNKVLNEHSSATALPLVRTINNQAGFDENFLDGTLYWTGAILLRMLFISLGEETFRASIKTYLDTYKFKNAEQNDVWKIMTEAAHAKSPLPEGVTIQTIMDTWTLKPGVPILTVTRNADGKAITVKQERFFDDQPSGGKPEENCWVAPLSYTTQKEHNFSDVKPKAFLTCKGPLTLQVNLAANEWIILNLKNAVPCLIFYDQQTWTALQNTLANESEYKTIDVLTRAKLISDIFEFAKKDLVTYQQAFALSQYLQHEAEYMPFKIWIPSINFIRSCFLGTKYSEPFKAFVRQYLKPRFLASGKIDDLPNTYQAKQDKIDLDFYSCFYEVPECMQQASAVFQKWYASPQPDQVNPIPPDLRELVYCGAMKNADENTWNFLLNRYIKMDKSTVDASVQIFVRSGLACTTNAKLMQRYLDYSLDATKIDKDHSFSVFSEVSETEVGYPLARDFLYNRYEDIIKYNGGDASSLESYVSDIVWQINTEEELTKFKSFTAKLKNMDDTIKSATEMAEKNVSFLKKNENELAAVIGNGKVQNA